jgi:hypothetical protein
MRAVWYDRQGPAREVLVCVFVASPVQGRACAISAAL